KAEAGKADEINTCIACNQACLDHTFKNKRASCLVNPRACHETELRYLPTFHKKKLAVVGAGPAGLAAATVAAERGHDVTLFDADDKVGGQFNIARQIPGKEDFAETLRYFSTLLKKFNVKVQLNTYVKADDLQGFDEVIVATGIVPRTPGIPGVEHDKVLSYLDVIAHKKPVGKSVAVIGAGGIGFDVSEYLTHSDASNDQQQWYEEWGVDTHLAHRSALVEPKVAPSPRQVYLLQRKESALGKNLGKTSGWVHRAQLKKKNVEMIAGVAYERIDDEGLHIRVKGQPRILPVDNIIVCAGQEPQRELAHALQAQGKTVHVIGGADVAAELDAKRAIRQGSELAAQL
ncbi:MAG: FAD-dependent oxidoreductase, partial [Ketobacter sp.]